MVKRKAKKSTKAKMTRTTKRKSTTRKRGSGNPFEIDNVRAMI